MITINTVSATKFSYNGINYFKNFTPVVFGNKISILNTYDACISLTTAPTHFSEYVLNGQTFASVALLQDALLPVIFTKNGLITTQWGDIDGSISAQADLQNVLNAKADLVSGKVPASQLPSYVDDVLEFANLAALPTTGETGKIYITLDTNKIYRWSGSTYIEITQGGVWGTITGTLSNQSDLQTALNNKQNASPDLSSIAGLTGTTGLLRKTAANTYSLDTNSYLPLSGGTLASSGSTNTLNINHSSGSGVAASITKGGNGEALTVVKSSGSGNAASITGGVTLLSELNLTTKLADAHINSAATWNAKIGGSGTTNYLAKFTSGSVLGNSAIYESGGNVGIGTTSPNAKLHISDANNGFNLFLEKTSGFGSLFLLKNTSSQSNDLFRVLNSSDQVISQITPTTNGINFSTGNVGINNTNPTQRLDVNGLINSTNGISVGGSGVSVVWTGTQAAYDAITTKSSTTIYFIQ
jgi:hypothetical protein